MKHSMAVAYNMKRRKKMSSHEAGMESDDMAPTAMNEPEEMAYAHGGDIVDHIMKKRKMYSEGGKVANEMGEEADSMPAEYDDLAIRDDLHSTYGDDDNSGDALGNAQEDMDRHDIVDRIMKSRAKKDRMPRPA